MGVASSQKSHMRMAKATGASTSKKLKSRNVSCIWIGSLDGVTVRCLEGGNEVQQKRYHDLSEASRDIELWASGVM